MGLRIIAPPKQPHSPEHEWDNLRTVAEIGDSAPFDLGRSTGRSEGPGQTRLYGLSQLVPSWVWSPYQETTASNRNYVEQSRTRERKERESPDKSAEGQQSQEISESRPPLKKCYISFYLAAPGLSCGTRDPGSWLQLVGSFLLQHVNSWLHHVGSSSLTRVLGPALGVLATGPPGKSPNLHILTYGENNRSDCSVKLKKLTPSRITGKQILYKNKQEIEAKSCTVIIILKRN